MSVAGNDLNAAGSQPKSQGGQKHMSNSIKAKSTDPEPFLKFIYETFPPIDEVLMSGGMLAAMQVSFTADAAAAEDFWKAINWGGGRYMRLEGHPAKVLSDWLIHQDATRKRRQEKLERQVLEERERLEDLKDDLREWLEISAEIDDLESKALFERLVTGFVEDYKAGLIAWDAFRNGRTITVGDLSTALVEGV
jgi:hypothetical protein